MSNIEKIVKYINDNENYLINISFKNGLKKYEEIVKTLNELKIVYPQILSHLLGNNEYDIEDSMTKLVGGNRIQNKDMIDKFEKLIKIVYDNKPEKIKDLLLKIINEYESIRNDLPVKKKYFSLYPTRHEIILNIYYFGNKDDPILDGINFISNLDKIRRIMDDYVQNSNYDIIDDTLIKVEGFDQKYEEFNIDEFNKEMLNKIRGKDSRELKEIMRIIIYVSEYVKLVKNRNYIVRLDDNKRKLNFRLLPSRLFDGQYEKEIFNDIFDGINLETLRKTTLLRSIKSGKISQKYSDMYFDIMNRKLKKITLFVNKKNILDKFGNTKILDMMNDDDLILIDDLPDNIKRYVMMIDYTFIHPS